MKRKKIEKLLNNSNEYLTKESALLLFKQLTEIIEDHQKKIDRLIIGSRSPF